MGKRKLSLLAAVVIMIGLFFVFAGCGGEDADTVSDSAPTAAGDNAEIIEWDMQAFSSPGTSGFIIVERWAEEIEKITGGRLLITVHAPGVICNPADTVDYLERGILEAGQTTGLIHREAIPEGDFDLGLPMSWHEPHEVYDAMVNRGLGDIIKEAYAEKGIVHFPYFGDPVYSFATTFPINRLEDIEGKAIRGLGVYGDFISKLGGTPTVVSPGEMYMALDLGTIDGTIFGASALGETKIDEVVDYYSLPTLNHAAVCILISEQALDQLPADLRNIVEYATPHIAWSVSLDYVRVTHDEVLNSVQQGNIELIELPEEELVKMRAVASEVWDELAAKSPRMQEGIDILRQQMADYGRPLD